jgi:FdhD protein
MPYVYQYDNGRFEQFEKAVVREQPLTIIVNGVELATFLCTPVKLDYLTIGFLAFEGIIRGVDDIRDLDVDLENSVVEVELHIPLVQPKKRVFTSGCGMGLTFNLRTSHYPPLHSDESITPAQIFPLMQQLMDGATMYKASRGIHAAALSDTAQVLLLSEDVGRHNALDKILGEALMKGIPTAGRLLLTSGRVSSEMLRKGAHMGTPFLISRTSPTTLSIEAAQRLGVTVIGYVRRYSFTLYTHPERLLYHGTPTTGLTPSPQDPAAGREDTPSTNLNG